MTSQLQSITKSEPHGAISVAALNTKTGQRFAAGRTSGMWTASAYKLFCLSAILIGRSADSLSGSEVGSAEQAIENSNNVAGYQLFLDAGGRPGLIDAARTFGMHHTVPGESDPTFTTTSGSDYLKLLEAITGQSKNDPLGSSARHFILNLMGEVEADPTELVGGAGGDAMGNLLPMPDDATRDVPAGTERVVPPGQQHTQVRIPHQEIDVRRRRHLRDEPEQRPR